MTFDANCKVILADVGARMEQVRKGERADVPLQSLRLKVMYEQMLSRLASRASSSDDIPEGSMCSSGVSPCFVCGGRREPLVSCAMCLLCAHPSCTGKVVEWADEYNAFTQVLELPRTVLDGIFSGGLCALCKRSDWVGFLSE